MIATRRKPRAPGIRERRSAAKSAMAMQRPDVAQAILKNTPDPQVNEAYANRMVDAFIKGGFLEARVDLRPYDFEPFQHNGGAMGWVKRVVRQRAHWGEVSMEVRGDGSVWLVKPATPDPSDTWVI